MKKHEYVLLFTLMFFCCMAGFVAGMVYEKHSRQIELRIVIPQEIPIEPTY